MMESSPPACDHLWAPFYPVMSKASALGGVPQIGGYVLLCQRCTVVQYKPAADLEWLGEKP